MIFTKNVLFRSMSLGLLALTFACNSDDNSTRDDEGFRIIPPTAATPLIKPTAFYIANEDWFGHDEGTVNQLDYALQPQYRIYRAANSGKKLGTTLAYATAYGDYYYFVSKQRNRFVVTDKNFKEVKTLEDINGDGRAFVGVSDSKGYISTGNGITIFDIKNLKTAGTIADVAGQTGNMVYADGKVYAVVQGKGLVIIDTKTDEVKITLAGNYTQVTIDRHGVIWAGKEKELIRINPKDYNDIKSYDIAPSNIPGTWGAWNAGSLTASMQEDALYWVSDAGAWGGGNKVGKFDTTTGTLNTEFHLLGNDADGNELAFYGAGLRVDPFNGDIVLLIKKNGWGPNGGYNWTRILSNSGAKKGEIFMQGGEANDKNGHYWFPSMPFFQDNNAPEILPNQIVLKPNKEFSVSIGEVIVDQDSPLGLIEKTITKFDSTFGTAVIENDKLIFNTNDKTGKSSITIRANSNGKVVEKDIELWVRN